MNNVLDQYKKSQIGRKTNKSYIPKPGELWWVDNFDGVKGRPILVIRFNNGIVSYRRCTTKVGEFSNRTIIEEYDYAGLEEKTYVDSEIRTMGRNRLTWRIGALSEYDSAKFGI